jgi:hypothetical protein
LIQASDQDHKEIVMTLIAAGAYGVTSTYCHLLTYKNFIKKNNYLTSFEKKLRSALIQQTVEGEV